MVSKPIPQEPLPTMADLNQILAPYQKSDIRKSVWQLVNTLIPYFVLWYFMIRSLEISFWLTLALVILAALFLVRIFIFFHDCGHNSFFPDKETNKRVGFWLGVLTFTPGEHWWHSHAIHHATSGNLDKRGTGDVETLTLEEFYKAPWVKRLGYQFFRNPLVMFGLGPIFMFLIMHRLPVPKYGKKETMSVVWANLAILVMVTGMSLLIGLKNYLILQLLVIWIGGGIGIWMFYVQHQYEEVYWARNKDWSYVASALLGASYYRLPKLMQWFTGNIGFHHIHHLSPRIPNYNLEKAHTNSPLIQKWAREIDIGESLWTPRLKVWDEANRQMTGFTKKISRTRNKAQQAGD